MEFKKVSLKEVVVYKIKWGFKILWLCLNYPFKKLESWM